MFLQTRFFEIVMKDTMKEKVVAKHDHVALIVLRNLNHKRWLFISKQVSVTND